MRIVINTLENIADIQWFPIFGLVILFTAFVLLIVRVIKMNKSEVDEISRLPLEEDDFQGSINQTNETKI
jgi:hypothetical protein